MNKKVPIRIRAASQEDVAFIFNSWLKSYRNSHFSRYIDNTVYYSEHHKLIERLVSDNQVLIACNTEDPNQLYGYICAGRVDNFLVVHYIYVKHSFRNLGIGKQLLNAFDHDPSVAGIYTHHTKLADRLGPRYNFVFHPYLMFNSVENSDGEKKEQE